MKPNESCRRDLVIPESVIFIRNFMTALCRRKTTNFLRRGWAIINKRNLHIWKISAVYEKLFLFGLSLVKFNLLKVETFAPLAPLGFASSSLFWFWSYFRRSNLQHFPALSERDSQRIWISINNLGVTIHFWFLSSTFGTSWYIVKKILYLLLEKKKNLLKISKS